jgi:hypothetical protein
LPAAPIPPTKSRLSLSLGIVVLTNSCFLLFFYYDVSLKPHALQIAKGWEAIYLSRDYSYGLKCFEERISAYFVKFIVFGLIAFFIVYHTKFLAAGAFVLCQFLSLFQNIQGAKNMLRKLILKFIQFLDQTEYDFVLCCL